MDDPEADLKWCILQHNNEERGLFIPVLADV